MVNGMLSGWCTVSARDRAVREVALQHKGLRALPRDVLQRTALVRLELGFNQLTALPDALSRLTQLEVLALSGNLLRDLAPVGCLQRLLQLWAAHNQLGNRLLTLPTDRQTRQTDRQTTDRQTD